jgi:hypothetical protein
MTMDAPEDQELRVKKDIQYLTRTLTPKDLDADVMFAKGRGIRSCTPPFDAQTGNGIVVSERLKRVQLPDEK